MTRLRDIQLCHHCRDPIHHRRGPIAPNMQLTHKDPRNTPIRLCLGCYFAYQRRYRQQGWNTTEQAKPVQQ